MLVERKDGRCDALAGLPPPFFVKERQPHRHHGLLRELVQCCPIIFHLEYTSISLFFSIVLVGLHGYRKEGRND